MVEQIPAVVFMAYLDDGIGEAYVSPQIEKTLGFSQSEWLEDPVRWYQQIHPDDKQRWSVEAAQMFLSGTAAAIGVPGDVARRARNLVSLRSQNDSPRGRPALVHSRRRFRHHRTEADRSRSGRGARMWLSAILETVGALVVVLDPGGRIVRFNRACERTTGYEFAEVKGSALWELFLAPEESRAVPGRVRSTDGRRAAAEDEESYWLTRERRPAADQLVHHHAARPGHTSPVYHRYRNRYHRAQTAGARPSWKSATANSAASARICTTVWDSISPASPS